MRLAMGMAIGVVLAASSFAAIHGPEALWPPLRERQAAMRAGAPSKPAAVAEIERLRARMAELQAELRDADERAERAVAAAEAAQQETAELEEALRRAAAGIEGGGEADDAAGLETGSVEALGPYAPLDELQEDPRPLSEALATASAALCAGADAPLAHGLFGAAGGGASERARLDAALPAVAASAPWLARLEIDGAESCAAAAIGREWLLTAAHCLSSRVVSAHVGPERGAAAETGRAFCHLGYDAARGAPVNDIALVRLRQPLPDTLPLASLAGPETLYRLSEGAPALAMGWGAKDAARVARIALTGAGGDRLYASAPGVSGCLGESGGPLVLDGGAAASLIGVASRGAEGCVEPGAGAPFTSVGFHHAWIDGVIALCAARPDC